MTLSRIADEGTKRPLAPGQPLTLGASTQVAPLATTSYAGEYGGDLWDAPGQATTTIGVRPTLALERLGGYASRHGTRLDRYRGSCAVDGSETTRWRSTSGDAGHPLRASVVSAGDADHVAATSAYAYLRVTR